MKTLFGIKNCDTVKKAINYLNSNKQTFDFHHFKTDGLERETLQSWCAQVGWERLLNKKSATWRALPPEVQQGIQNETAAIDLLLEKPSLIKRPVLVENGQILSIGFHEEEYARLR